MTKTTCGCSKKDRINNMFEEVQCVLNRLHELFVPDMKLTFIARLPGNNGADVLITSDDFNEIQKLIERRKP